EDLKGSYTFLTPISIRFWCPTTRYESKPATGAIYGSWRDVLNMYKIYVEKS
ncbi:hypothetical protein R6Q59_019064, partial [Mikania micrantha]